MSDSPATNPDLQEALSTRYATDVVRLRRLKSGRFAVYNAAAELCDIVDGFWTDISEEGRLQLIEWPPEGFFEHRVKPVRAIDLKDLGLV